MYLLEIFNENGLELFLLSLSKKLKDFIEIWALRSIRLLSILTDNVKSYMCEHFRQLNSQLQLSRLSFKRDIMLI